METIAKFKRSELDLDVSNFHKKVENELYKLKEKYGDAIAVYYPNDNKIGILPLQEYFYFNE